MASWQYYTTADVSIFLPSKPPVYDETEGGRLKNVALVETVGGKFLSETWGSDRRTIRLYWPRISGTDLALFDTLHSTYGGGKAAFKIEVPAGLLPNVTAATKVRVRWLEPKLRHRWIAYDRYELAQDLVEDLT